MQQALAELRVMAAKASGADGAEGAKTPAEESAFADMLKDAIETVNRHQIESSELSNAFARGEDVQLTDVMVAMQKAKVSFEAVKAVRNHLLEAYREISRMPI